jgi:hypothetical protein
VRVAAVKRRRGMASIATSNPHHIPEASPNREEVVATREVAITGMVEMGSQGTISTRIATIEEEEVATKEESNNSSIMR